MASASAADPWYQQRGRRSQKPAVGPRGPPVGPGGPPWSPVGPRGPPWARVAPVVPCGPLWAPVVPCGSPWAPLVPRGPPRGFPWSPVAPPWSLRNPGPPCHLMWPPKQTNPFKRQKDNPGSRYSRGCRAGGVYKKPHKHRIHHRQQVVYM